MAEFRMKYLVELLLQTIRIPLKRNTLNKPESGFWCSALSRDMVTFVALRKTIISQWHLLSSIPR